MWMWLFGIPNVEKLKKNRDIKGLIEALGYGKDANIRRDAAKALGEINDARGVEPLIDLLEHEVWWIRKGAAEALNMMDNLRAKSALHELEIRQQASLDKDLMHVIMNPQEVQRVYKGNDDNPFLIAALRNLIKEQKKQMRKD
jgi:predicted xylose isomerase-like sugar epimerase